MSENQEVKQRPVVPEEFAGKWIAWTSDGSRIVASGDSLKETVAGAQSAGAVDPGFEWIPPANLRLMSVTS
jgi:hypothetical protein